MKQLIFLSGLFTFLVLSGKITNIEKINSETPVNNNMEIECNMEELHDIVAENAIIEKVGSGYSFTEGPAVN